ncbi:hypothetical protein PS623_04351 [Pseudomonas fluorescens]|uniref:lytic transglycosylase domain-containing protein n=1 Tax=Pseudomonas fluorescens TaxID=294 RepID=UPI0012404480|nr:lytic transglycosylase domain-containing protein [Pseudomonas fluorescens]VVN22264.1 hypothetical protein PS623_04351 [Pseudomonas fluorescens]
MLVKAAILALAQQCAPNVAPHTMQTLVMAESSGNPYAIGVVGAQLTPQPATKDEAIATAKGLISQGAKIAGGLGQIYVDNWEKLGLTVETVFDQCQNITAAGQILSTCYGRGVKAMGDGQAALQAAFSCYYSNNFSRGLVKEGPNRPSYVMKIAMDSERIRVPGITFKPSDVNEVAPGQKPELPQEPAEPAKPEKALEEFQQLQAEKKDPEGAQPTGDPTSWDVLGDFN